MLQQGIVCPIAKKLREVVEQEGLTVRELARKYWVEYSTVNSLLNNGKPKMPSTRELVKLTAQLGFNFVLQEKTAKVVDTDA